jgi:secondary thiamine-phosphate synthase enzyme
MAGVAANALSLGHALIACFFAASTAIVASGEPKMTISLSTHTLHINTSGRTDIVDLTPQVQGLIGSAGLAEGSAAVFAVGSTAGITTVEFEPGLVKTDIARMFDRIAPYGAAYAHNDTWGDDNGAAHLRASLLGSSLSVPFLEGKLLLGAWQQIVLIDFDTRARSRRVVVQILAACAE